MPVTELLYTGEQTIEMEGCKVIGKDSVLLCGVITAFAIFVRVSVGLAGYSGELCEC